MCRLQISVTDTGIGITSEQKARLFNAFGQAEAGISRKFGGTGLGLAISKKIVAMMGGDIWVESEHGIGSKFTFTVLLKRDCDEQKRLLPGNIDWSNIRMFAVDDDPEICNFFMNVSTNMGIFCETATSEEDACEKLAADDNYNIYFIDWKLPGIGGIELVRQLQSKSAQKPVAILFSSTDWDLIEGEARGAGVDMFLQKPLFQSDVVNLINKCIGNIAEYNETGEYAHDFSGHTILLAEDVEINREIVLTLLEPTGMTIECAENGVQALDMFKEAPDKYDMVFMDMQMPKMDGCEATRQIRGLDHPNARTIPIIAMTANVFKDDIDNCLAAGMNDHIGKPLIIDIVYEKLRKFLLAQ
jgi:CheY-like chemotaxis protein